MYLVDTSVWIDYFREIETKATLTLNDLLDRHLPFGITGVIYQEILQGAAGENDYNQLKNYFSTQRFFHPLDKISTYDSAAKLFFLSRHKGITIRSTIDCLIAQIAIEHNLILLHNDRNFNHLKKIEPSLNLVGM